MLAPTAHSPPVLVVVDPAGPDEPLTAEVNSVDDAADQGAEGAAAGTCRGDRGPFFPDLALRPWEAHTLVVCTARRRSRWAEHVAAGNVSIVPAVTPHALSASLRERAYQTMVAGVINPPTDRAYAAHSAAVMLGHVAAWEAAARVVISGAAHDGAGDRGGLP